MGGTHHTTLHPFAHQFCNNYSNQDQLRAVLIPDVDPFGLPKDADFSMAAGDFLEVYDDQLDSWDCVASCFFLDTARNVVAYLEVWLCARLQGRREKERSWGKAGYFHSHTHDTDLNAHVMSYMQPFYLVFPRFFR
eukprot:m.201174 g.201174  ORF g.201174 m.201174 type:complete len:136 (-) comp25958_c0_seq5:489-896(-)